MINVEYQALKIGITTTAARSDRISQHIARGWTLFRTWNTSTGASAENIEQSILDWWRDDLGAPETMTQADMPQNGYTETASLVHVDLDETAARIDAEVNALGRIGTGGRRPL